MASGRASNSTIFAADDAPRMPWGEYRGWLLRDVPDDYIAELWSIVLEPDLHRAVADEVQRRRADGRDI